MIHGLVSDVRDLLCYAQTIQYILFGARDYLLERDVTILVNILFEFLRCILYSILYH